MKVICVDASTDKDSPMIVDLIEGAIYTVIGQVISKNKLWYSLAEKDSDEIYSHDAFIPCSDIDETELVNQREQLQTA